MEAPTKPKVKSISLELTPEEWDVLFDLLQATQPLQGPRLRTVREKMEAVQFRLDRVK